MRFIILSCREICLFTFLIFLSLDTAGQENPNNFVYEIKDTVKAGVLLQEGRELAREQKFDEALVKLNEAKDIYQQTIGVNSFLYLKSIFHIGSIYFLTSKLDIANKMLDPFILDPHQLSKDEIFGYYEMQGHVHFYKRDYKKAIESFQKSLEVRLIYKDSNDVSVSDNYAWIGSSYYRQSEFNTALDYFKKALKIKEYIHGEESLLLVELIQRIGIVYLSTGQYDDAIAYLNKTLELRIVQYGKNHLVETVILYHW